MIFEKIKNKGGIFGQYYQNMISFDSSLFLENIPFFLTPGWISLFYEISYTESIKVMI